MRLFLLVFAILVSHLSFHAQQFQANLSVGVTAGLLETIESKYDDGSGVTLMGSIAIHPRLNLLTVSDEFAVGVEGSLNPTYVLLENSPGDGFGAMLGAAAIVSYGHGTTRESLSSFGVYGGVGRTRLASFGEDSIEFADGITYHLGLRYADGLISSTLSFFALPSTENSPSMFGISGLYNFGTW